MTDKEKLAKVKAEIEGQIAELTPTKEKIGIVGGVAVKRHLESILSFIDSLQEEPKECMYSKGNYTDEDRKALCDGCEEECKYNKKEPVSKDKLTFTSLPRLLDRIKPTDRAKWYSIRLADALEKEGYITDAKIVRESIKLMNGEKVPMATKDEEPISVWHDAIETPEIDRTILLVAINGNSSLALWDGKSLKSCTLGGGHSVFCKNDKWCYIDELIKL